RRGLARTLLHHVVNPSRLARTFLHRVVKPSTNGASRSLKRCPSFQKTLPIILENIAHRFKKRCP
ncbi:MAG: hypothetical protein ACI3ZW_04775, partial [Parabacteroides sp.]